MGFEQTVAAEDIMDCIADSVTLLSAEIAKGIIDVNGGPPSAVFLAGGGSKLKGVLEGVRDALQMDDKRIAIAGNNFKATAFSKEYDLNNPELATPLGIAVSTGLNMINDSYHLTLNGKRARLFRNGELNILNVLTMNGYQYRDLFGRSGSSMILTVNGKRNVLYGEPATNSTLTLNGNPATPSELVKAGDVLEFIPAKAGEAAKAKVSDIVPQDAENAENLVITVNGQLADFDTELNSGDVIVTGTPDEMQKRAEEAQNALVKTAQETTEAETEKDGQSEQTSAQEPNGKPEQKPNPVVNNAQAAKPETTVKRTAIAPDSSSHADEAAKPVRARTEKQARKTEQVLPPEQAPATEQTAEVEQTPAAEPAPFTLPRRRERRPMTILDRPPGSENTPAKQAQPKNKFEKKEPGQTNKNDPFSNITQEEYEAAVAPLVRNTWHFTLNDKPVTFPPKDGNAPYLLLDMLQHSGLDFDHLTSPVILAVNGVPGTFQQELKENDTIIIRQDK